MEAALNANLWGEARKHLDFVIEKQLTVRSCRLMSQLEQLERRNDNESRKWLEKAMHAVPDTSWACSSCGAVAHEWAALCGNCGNFDSMIWRTPPTITSLSSKPYIEEQFDETLELEGK